MSLILKCKTCGVIIPFDPSVIIPGNRVYASTNALKNSLVLMLSNEIDKDHINDLKIDASIKQKRNGWFNFWPKSESITEEIRNSLNGTFNKKKGVEVTKQTFKLTCKNKHTHEYKIDINELPANPKLNDEYWYKFAFDLINGSIERLRTAANTIQVFLLWAWGIYTASAIFTIQYNDISNYTLLIILSFPYFFLLLGYWYAHLAQMPVTDEFDYTIPQLIRAAYVRLYNKSSRNLQAAKVLSFFGIASLAAALMAAFIIKNYTPEKISLQLELIDGKPREIHITGSFPPEDTLEFKLEKYYGQDSIQLKQFNFINTKSGQFFKTFPINDNCNKFVVSVGYKDEGYKKILVKEIMPKKD